MVAVEVGQDYAPYVGYVYSGGVELLG